MVLHSCLIRRCARKRPYLSPTPELLERDPRTDRSQWRARLRCSFTRGPFPIDLGLRYRRDVVRYVFVTLCAAVVATGIGVATLAADRTISWSQYWSSAAGWFAGDTAALLGFAPSLLIHVLPIIRPRLSKHDASPVIRFAKIRHHKRGFNLIQCSAQALSVLATLWFIFAGPLVFRQLYYLEFVPIIWIAMRQGVRRVVTGLLF
jgi:hypothetical protein